MCDKGNWGLGVGVQGLWMCHPCHNIDTLIVCFLSQLVHMAFCDLSHIFKKKLTNIFML